MDNQRKVCDVLLTEHHLDLNEWENEFVNSIKRRLIYGKPLTEKQAEKLDQLKVKFIEGVEEGDLCEEVGQVQPFHHTERFHR